MAPEKKYEGGGAAALGMEFFLPQPEPTVSLAPAVPLASHSNRPNPIEPAARAPLPSATGTRGNLQADRAGAPCLR